MSDETKLQNTNEVEATPTKNKEALPDVPDILRTGLMETVKKDWEDIVASQSELAKGIYVKEFIKDKNGKYQHTPDGKPVTKVYYQKPDRDAGQYLINQAIGKPKETSVVESKVTLIMDI